MINYLTGVSKWNYEKWEQEGKPVLDRTGWCKLCMVICSKDMVNLEDLFTISQQLSKI